MSGQLHAPAIFNPWGKSPMYSLDRRLSGTQRMSGNAGEVKRISDLSGN